MKSKKIIELNENKAKEYFMEEKSYVNFDLPYYFSFSKILNESKTLLQEENISNQIKKSKKYEGVNYVFLSNKDGSFAWRPFQIIHPILYTDLVNLITEKNNWNQIVKRFETFRVSKINCISIPMVSQDDNKSNKASQVIKWWEEIEQQSLKMALDYDYIFITDITNCYGSIYTHSIDWALTNGGRPQSKKNLASKPPAKTLGGEIDIKIRNMTYGQTNGIPQGSSLMDFIAEIILGYADTQLVKKIEGEKIKDYHILRFRDDYRIFVNNPIHGKEILKCLSAVLYELGMKMNTSKTIESEDIIMSSIKKEKLERIFIAPDRQYWQKELLRIYQISKKYPNSGLISKELSIYHDALRNACNAKEFKGNIEVLISILSIISFNSPITINWVSAIITIFLKEIKNKQDKEKIVKKIHKKFKKIPNSSLIDAWLQRISSGIGIEMNYNDNLAKLALNKINNSVIWNSSWLDTSIIEKINSISVSKLPDEIANKLIKPVISRKEIELFKLNYRD